MARTNVAGVTFTISLLLSLLIYVIWRLYNTQKELVDCYKDQLLNAVTVMPPDKP